MPPVGPGPKIPEEGSVDGCLAAKCSIVLLPACSFVAQGLPDDQSAIGQQLPVVGIRCQNSNICAKAIHSRTEGGNLPQPLMEMGRGGWPNVAVEIFHLVVTWNVVRKRIPHFYKLSRPNSTHRVVGMGSLDGDKISPNVEVVGAEQTSGGGTLFKLGGRNHDYYYL